MDADEEVTLRNFIRQLPSTSFWMLLVCVGFWALTKWLGPGDLNFWHVLLAWPAVTIALGPIFWIRFQRSDAPGFWLGFVVAMLWIVCIIPVLIGLGYAVVAVLFDVGR